MNVVSVEQKLQLKNKYLNEDDITNLLRKIVVPVDTVLYKLTKIVLN